MSVRSVWAHEDSWTAVIATQDWSGLDAVLAALMDLLRTCGVPDPAQRGGMVR